MNILNPESLDLGTIRLAERMKLLRSHGITRDTGEMTRPPDGSWYYEQVDLGFNYRLRDLQAALGVSQMERLDAYVDRRHVLAERYAELLNGLPVKIPWQDPDVRSAYHLYPVRLLTDVGRSWRREVFERLRASGIGVNVHYIPVHLQPYYRKRGFSEGDLPESERYYSDALTLPLFPGLSESQQDVVVKAVREALSA